MWIEPGSLWDQRDLRIRRWLRGALRLAAADIDGNGQRDLIASFGPAYGIWAWMNNTGWVHLFDKAP